MFLRTLAPWNFARLYVKFAFNRLKAAGKFNELNLAKILMPSLNLWLNLQLNLRHGILKFSGANRAGCRRNFHCYFYASLQ